MTSSDGVRDSRILQPDFAKQRLGSEFMDELELLNITIDEYDRMLAVNESRVIITDNTVR